MLFKGLIIRSFAIVHIRGPSIDRISRFGGLRFPARDCSKPLPSSRAVSLASSERKNFFLEFPIVHVICTRCLAKCSMNSTPSPISQNNTFVVNHGPDDLLRHVVVFVRVLVAGVAHLPPLDRRMTRFQALRQPLRSLGMISRHRVTVWKVRKSAAKRE